MTNFEFIKLHEGFMKTLIRCKIRLKDCDYTSLYDEYQKTKAKGEKVTYVVAVLAQKYHVSERKVYQLIHTFGMDCTPDAEAISPSS